MDARGSRWWEANSRSGNGLEPSCNKPLPGPKLAQIYVAIRRHQATMTQSLNKTAEYQMPMKELQVFVLK